MADDLIIRPPKKRRLPDPFIAPVSGSWGTCQLCTHYCKLTENHIPPQCVGNHDSWQAQSYLTTAAADKELYFGRNFRSGVRFKTLCKDCNSGLGGGSDKEIGAFFEGVKKLIESPIILRGRTQLSVRPNLLYKGLLAHMISANDSGVPTPFDQQGRDVYFGRTPIGLSSWNLFYWLYIGEPMFLMRRAFCTRWWPRVELKEMQILKFYPLGFLFSQEPTYFGLPNVLKYVTRKDDDHADLPIPMAARQYHPLWPATVSPSSSIMFGGDAFGLIGIRT